MSATPLSERIRDLRQTFDRGFAEPAGGPRATRETYLRITVAGDVYLLALAEIGGLHAGRPVVPVPSVDLDLLLGLTSIRGATLPVFSLRHLLGYPREVDVPRWLAVAGAPNGIGLAFDEFGGLVQAEPRLSPAGRAAAHVRGLVHGDGPQSWALLSVSSILHTLDEARAHRGDPLKE